MDDPLGSNKTLQYSTNKTQIRKSQRKEACRKCVYKENMEKRKNKVQNKVLQPVNQMSQIS